MRKYLILSIILMSFVVAQAPVDIQTPLNDKIVQEHKATRKFFSDEMTRQRTEFYNMMDERAINYENQVNDLLRTTAIKLFLLWFGSGALIIGLHSFLRNRMEKRRYSKLKDSLTKDVKEEIDKETQKKTNDLQQKRIQIDQRIEMLNKAKPQLNKIKEQIESQLSEINRLTNGG